MNRRGFLSAILAAGVAPAFIGSSVLMPVRKLWTPPDHIVVRPGLGLDDSAVIQDAIDAQWKAGGGTVFLTGGVFQIGATILLREGVNLDGSGSQLYGTDRGGGPMIQIVERYNGMQFSYGGREK
jgi:hypothetical protein